MKTKVNNIRYLHDYVIQGLLNVSARPENGGKKSDRKGCEVFRLPRWTCW